MPRRGPGPGIRFQYGWLTWLPGSLLVLLLTSALPVTALAALSIGTEEQAVAQFKTTKRIAKYQSTPKGKQRCALCRHFKPPNHCQIVDGEISPNGWCRFFVAKQ